MSDAALNAAPRLGVAPLLPPLLHVAKRVADRSNIASDFDLSRVFMALTGPALARDDGSGVDLSVRYYGLTAGDRLRGVVERTSFSRDAFDNARAATVLMPLVAAYDAAVARIGVPHGTAR